MHHRYFGATYLAGATYLDTNFTIKVEEGIQYGSTTEYLDMGEFAVSRINWQGENDSVSIEAESGIERLSSINSLVTREFQGFRSYSYLWYSSDELNDFRTSGDGEVLAESGSGKFWTIPNSSFFVLHEDDWEGAYSEFSFCKGSHDVNVSYLIDVVTDAWPYVDGYVLTFTQNGYNLIRDDHHWVGNTLASGTGLSLGVSTWYTIHVHRNQADIYFNIRNYFTPFTKIAENTVKDWTFNHGQIGVRFENNSSTNQKISSAGMIINGVNTPLTIKDSITKVMNFGDEWDLSFSQFINGFSGWEGNSGASFILGVTNNLQQLDLTNIGASSGLNNVVAYSGISYDQFVFDCEIRGTSGNFAGIYMGASDYRRGMQISFGATGNQLFYYYNGLSRYYKQNTDFKCLPDKWYRLRMVKDGTYGAFFINDGFICSTEAETYYDSSELPQEIGLMQHKEGVSGTLTSWRNGEVSQFDQLKDSFLLEQNSSPKSALNRLMPSGGMVEKAGNTWEFFMVGDSRASVDMGEMIDEISSVDSYRLDTGEAVRGDVYAKVGQVANPAEMLTRTDRTRYSILYDSEISSQTEKNEANLREIAEEELKARAVTFKGGWVSGLQRNDRVIISDSRIGTTFSGKLVSQMKTFSSRENVRQSLKIAPDDF